MAEKRDYKSNDSTKRDKRRKENNCEEEEEMKENIPQLDTTFDEAVAGPSSNTEDKNGASRKKKIKKHVGKRKRKEWRRGKLFKNALRDKANIEARVRKNRQLIEELETFDKENEGEYGSEEELSTPKDRSLFNVEYYVSNEFQQERENYIQQQADNFNNSDVQSETYIKHVIDEPQKDPEDNNQQQLDSIIDTSNIKIEIENLEEIKQLSDPVCEPVTCDNIQNTTGQSSVKILPKFRIRSKNDTLNRTSSSKGPYEDKCVNMESSNLENVQKKNTVKESTTYWPKSRYAMFGNAVCSNIECTDINMKHFLGRFAVCILEKLQCLFTTNNETINSFSSVTLNNQRFLFGYCAVWNLKKIFTKVSGDVIEELNAYYVPKSKTYNAYNYLFNMILLVDQFIPYLAIRDMIMFVITIICSNALNKYPPLNHLLNHVLLLNDNSQYILRREILRIKSKVNNSTHINMQQKLKFNDQLVMYSQIPTKTFLFPTVVRPLNTDFTKSQLVNNYTPCTLTGNGNTRSNTATSCNKNVDQSNASLLCSSDTVAISCSTNTTRVAPSTSTQVSNVLQTDEKFNFGNSDEANRESIAVSSLLELSQCDPRAQTVFHNQEASQPMEKTWYTENKNISEPEATANNSASTIGLNNSNQDNELSPNVSIKIESETPPNNSDIDDQSENPSQDEFQSGQPLNEQQHLQHINVVPEQTNDLISQSSSNTLTRRKVPPHLQTPLHIQIPPYSQVVPHTRPRPPRQVYLDPRIYPNLVRQHPQTPSQMFRYPPTSSSFFNYPNPQLPSNLPMYLPQHPQVPFPNQFVPYPQTYNQLPPNVLPRLPELLPPYSALPPRLEAGGYALPPMLEPQRHALPPRLEPRGHALPPSLEPRGHGLTSRFEPHGHALFSRLVPHGHALPPRLEPRGHALSPRLEPCRHALPQRLRPRGHTLPQRLEPHGHSLPPRLEPHGQRTIEIMPQHPSNIEHIENEN